MGSLTTVVNQFMDSLFKVHSSSQRILTMSDLAKLHQAVKENDANDVSSLIKSGADVNLVYQQETAFTRAVDGKHFQAADVIIASKQFNPNAKNQFDRSPIFMVAKAGRVDYVKRLLDMGARVNDADVRGVTPLSACAWEDNHEAAEVLIQHGANIDQPDHLKQTPLHRACSNVSIKMVQLLLRNNCSVNQLTKEKETPLMAALPSNYNYQVAGKKISDMLSICDMLIKAGCDLNSQDNRGRTALHQAVESNDVYGVCLLAESGCELDVEDCIGTTPFQTAILPNKCHYDIARYLVYYGADVMRPVKTSNELLPPGLSPLAIVLNTIPTPTELERKWSRALLLRSLWRSVYPDRLTPKATANNYTPPGGPSIEKNKELFHEAIEREVLEWLNSCIPCSLQHQAILKIRGTLGTRNIIPRINLLPVGFGLKQSLCLGLRPDWMPLSKTCQLHLYIKDGDNDKVKDIIESGTDVNIPIDNRSPLALALETGNIEAAKMILSSCKKPYLTMVNASGDNALHVAAKYGRDEVIDDILGIYGGLDSINYHGETPLHVATHYGQFSTAGILINKGADLKIDENKGMSLLHIAAASGAADVVKLLLDRGMDPNIEDKFANTPLHVAASKGHEYLKREIHLPTLYRDVVSASLDTIQMRLNDSMPKYTRCTTEHLKVAQCLIQSGADITKRNQQSRTPFQCAQYFKASDLFDVLNVGK